MGRREHTMEEKMTYEHYLKLINKLLEWVAADDMRKTTVDPEITAEPLDAEGTLIIFDEEVQAE